MKKIRATAGSTMMRNAGRAFFSAGLVMALLTSGLPAELAAQGRGGAQNQDLSLPLVEQAFKMAEGRYLMSFSRYCMLNGPNTANGKGDAATPSRLFDNFYYVGRTDVGAWVLRTSDGLVLFDTLYSTDEAESIIVSGMRELGLDPDEIRMVVLTHSHGDHSGGMPYFREREVPVLVGGPDWEGLGGAPNPESIISDGQVVTFGDTSITFLLIPGHTNGTIGAMFPVFENGERHLALLAGGIGPVGGLEQHRTAIDSLAHVASVTESAGVDVFVDPHEAIIDTGAWEYIMHPEHRLPNQNNLIVGADGFQQFIQMLSTCMQARVVMFEQQAAEAGR